MAHAGTMAHSHLMVSLVHAHYINQEIIESKKLSVNIVDEAWLKENIDNIAEVLAETVAEFFNLPFVMPVGNDYTIETEFIE